MLGAADSEALGKWTATEMRHTQHLEGSTFLVLCCLLYRRGQGSADRLCVPAREQVLRELKVP